MEVLETRMELVILSTVAAVAILIAELRDLARGNPIVRSTTPAVTPRLAPVADLSPGKRAANEQSAAPRPELDRAA
jgi:hypothetical protein